MDFLPPSPYDYSLQDLFGDIRNRYNKVGRRDELRRQFQQAGIPGGRRGGEAPMLARLMSYNNPADPQIQARYLALLKQLGHLPRQAY